MGTTRDSLSVRPAAVMEGPGSIEASASGQDAWITRLREGDPVALDRLAHQELPRVTRLLARLLGARRDMEDLVQTVFLETCRALPGYRGESSLSTFVGGITVRVARRAMRPTAWFTRRAYVEVEPVELDDPEQASARSEQLARVHLALQKVAPKKRVAFLLWALEGLDVEQIAELTGASASATKSRIFYAQKELRRMAARDPSLRGLLQGGDDGAR